MEVETGILIWTAISIGILHTLLGPDHYLPFVAMSKCNCWSFRKTVLLTVVCGAGHVMGSVAIGCIGLLLGTMVAKLEVLESMRGDSAAWLLIGLGLAYLVWGIWHAIRDLPHTHLHAHADGTVHNHPHKHDLAHRHLHNHQESRLSNRSKRSFQHATPWFLFLIFLFGPCEALIPLLMYPAAESNLMSMVAIVLCFGVATVGTMTAMVMLMAFGLNWLKTPDFHRYSHALSGLAVLLCGVMVKSGL